MCISTNGTPLSRRQGGLKRLAHQKLGNMLVLLILCLRLGVSATPLGPRPDTVPLEAMAESKPSGTAKKRATRMPCPSCGDHVGFATKTCPSCDAVIKRSAKDRLDTMSPDRLARHEAMHAKRREEVWKLVPQVVPDAGAAGGVRMEPPKRDSEGRPRKRARDALESAVQRVRLVCCGPAESGRFSLAGSKSFDLPLLRPRRPLFWRLPCTSSIVKLPRALELVHSRIGSLCCHGCRWLLTPLLRRRFSRSLRRFAAACPSLG